MSDAFLQSLNEATEKLLRRGDWDGTVLPVQLCVVGSCIVFPRWCGEIRKVSVCKNNMPVKNMWFNMLDYERRGCGGSGWGSWFGAGWNNWIGGNGTLIGNGRSPVFQDILGEGRTVRAYPRCQADIGKTLTIFGTDNNGQTLTHQNSDGTWSNGAIINLLLPFGSTSTFVRHIDYVLKDETQCPVDVYGYDAANDVLEDCAHYESTETNPDFARYKLAAGCSSGACCPKSIVALVKLQFVPVKADTDLVLIENLSMLKNMMTSVKFAEAGDIANARQYEAEAIREGNLSLYDRDQFDGIPVSINPFNGTGVGYQRIF